MANSERAGGILGDGVRAADVYSSGMSKVVGITGRRYGRLLVIDLAGQNHRRADVMAIVPKKNPLSTLNSSGLS